jgi:hypothetical protein
MSAPTGGYDNRTGSSQHPGETTATEPGHHLLTGNSTTPAWPGRSGTGRLGRAVGASLIALLGLAFLAVGPTAVAVGWHGYLEIRAAEELAAQPVAGTEVRDGPVSFVVHEISCKTDEAWSVNGRVCEVRVTARNHGQEAVTIPSAAQGLLGPEGLRHLPVSDPEPFGTLRQGDEETAVIEFDVPPHALITHVAVHADAYSEGVRIRFPDE